MKQIYVPKLLIIHIIITSLGVFAICLQNKYLTAFMIGGFTGSAIAELFYMLIIRKQESILISEKRYLDLLFTEDTHRKLQSKNKKLDKK